MSMPDCDGSKHESSARRVLTRRPRRRRKTQSLNAASTVYGHLDDDSIRLIRILPVSTSDDIHCSLEAQRHYFEAQRPYIALSYCWGDRRGTRPITLNGHCVHVTTNLWKALSSILVHHQDFADKPFWIDALCINQANYEERNHQVHQMWRIYSSASEVIAWLGGASDSGLESSAFEALDKIAQSCTSQDTSCEGWRKHHSFPADDQVRAIQQLFQRKYFRRTWIIQEFVQARILWLMCGRHIVNAAKLFHLQKTLATSGGQAVELIGHRQEHGSGNTLMPKTTTEVVRWLTNTVFSYSRSTCFESRDKIFALLGDTIIRKLDPEMKLKPDYSMRHDELARAFIHYCDSIITDHFVKFNDYDDAEIRHEISLLFDRLVYYIGRALNIPIRSESSSSIGNLSAYYDRKTGEAVNYGVLKAHILVPRTKCTAMVAEYDDHHPDPEHSDLADSDLKNSDLKKSHSWRPEPTMYSIIPPFTDFHSASKPIFPLPLELKVMDNTGDFWAGHVPDCPGDPESDDSDMEEGFIWTGWPREWMLLRSINREKQRGLY